MAIGSLLCVAGAVVFLPEDHLLEKDHRAPIFHPWVLTGFILKNLIAGVLLISGIAMLVLPGQGLLTIILALTLLDFPGKRRYQRQLLTRPGVIRKLNALRARFGQKPFVKP